MCNRPNKALLIKRLSIKRKWEEVRSCSLPPGLLALTQVCRCIRLEVLPLYRDCLSHTTVSCRAGDIYDYVETWVIPLGIKKEDVIGRLVLDLGRSYDDNDWVILDIRPLLQLGRQFPDLYLEINDLDDPRYVRQSPRHARIEHTLVDLLAIDNFDKFYNYVETATDKLVWHDNRGGPALVFEMKPDCWEEWMAEKSRGDEPDWVLTAEWEANTIDWARRCGLAFMEDDKDDILCSPENIAFKRAGQVEIQDGMRSRTYHRRTRRGTPHDQQ